MKSSKLLKFLIILGLFFGLTSLILGLTNKSRLAKRTIIPTTNVTDGKNQNPLSDNTNYAYKNENKNYSTYFPKDFLSLDSNIKFEVNKSSIVFSPLQSINNTQAQPNKNQILYPKIFQQGESYIDLLYTVESSQLKEEYILNQKQTVPKLIQKVSLFNAYPVIKDNQISFLHPSSDSYVFKIPAPFMYEQNNPSTKHNGIIIDLQCEDPSTPLKDCRSFIFTKEITKEGQNWLNDPARQYPVIIDPFVNGDPCWGTGTINGMACDLGCTQNGVTAHSVYSTCTKGTQCTGTGCWWTTSGTCNSGCSVGTTAVTATAYPGCANNTTVCGESNCWTAAGVCDTNCNKSTTTATTGYPSCSSTFCGTPGCWQYNSACDAGCNRPSSGSTTYYPTYTDCVNKTNGNVDVTGAASGCSTDGSGICYIFFTPRTRYGGASCASYSVWDYRQSCTWWGGTTAYSYAVSGVGVTGRYTGSGTCNSTGTGNCYKLTNGTSYNTSNGACGSGGCGTTTLYQRTVCSWVAAKYTPVTTGTGVKMFTGSGACGTYCWTLTGQDTTTYTGNGTCGAGPTGCAGAGTRYTGATKCNWAAATHPWNATGSITKYTGSGVACDEINGTGACYKLSGGATTWTGSVACPAGGSNCAGQLTRYDRTQCTWLKGSGGSDIKIEGLMIEGLRFN